MKLSSYLEMNHLTQREMATKVGVAQPVLQRWLYGRWPDLKFAQRIHLATQGQVSLFDWPDSRER